MSDVPSKLNVPLKERLVAFAKGLREKADNMPSGAKRDELLMKASQADAASSTYDWISSPGLQAPK